MTWQPIAVLAYAEPGEHRIVLSHITGPSGGTLSHLRCLGCDWQQQTVTDRHAMILAAQHARRTFNNETR